ncbi:hypothetical protein [Oceanobacillus jeddahense]|uniref:hypothetical protein n=1 Tax=Oceanobacillus jeddahense TaxID=1462527 RepID=UPI00059612DA|nr:hypothetical protein [Oceanobacillus jeddahense]
MKKYTKGVIRVGAAMIILFTLISFITNRWSFLWMCFIIVFLHLMFAVLVENKNKYVKKVNENHSK